MIEKRQKRVEIDQKWLKMTKKNQNTIRALHIRKTHLSL